MDIIVVHLTEIVSLLALTVVCVDFMVENRDLETSIKKVRAIITIYEKLL